MKIVCPNCRTAYDVNPSSLGSGGRQVRCVRCGTMWFAEFAKRAVSIVQPEAQSIPPAAPDTEPPAPAGTGAAAGVDADPTHEEAPVNVPAVAQGDSIAATAADAAVLADAPGPDGAPAPELVGEAGTATDPPQDAGTTAPDLSAPTVDIESVAARRIASRRAAKRPPSPNWRRHKLAAAVVALAVIDAGLIIGRADVVRTLPQTASLFEAIGLPVNLRNLAFKDIRTKHEQHDGVQILVIEGAILAGGNSVTEVPRMRFSIQAANGHEIYAWTALPTRSKLASGEALPFRTRLASPPEQGRSVKVRFFTRHDLAAGLR